MILPDISKINQLTGMTMILAFTIQLILLSGIPFYLAKQNSSVRSISFYCYLSMLLLLANYLGAFYSIPITSNIAISGGTTVYCAFMMTTILFVIIEKEISVIRGIIRLVVSVTVFMVFLSMTISAILRSPEIINPFNTSADLVSVSLIVTSIGGLLTITELVSMIFLFERIKSRVKNVYAVSVLYILTFILILCLDGLVFPLILIPFDSHWLSNVAGGIASNFILATAFGTFMLLFLVIFRNQLLEYIDRPMLLRELIIAPRGKLIDEIERKNKSLVLSDQKFRNLAESIDDIFFSMDQDMLCTYWNKAAERTGCKAQEIVDRPVFDVFEQTEDATLEAFLRQVLKSGRPSQSEFVLPLMGQLRDFEVSAYPFSAGVSVLAKDITERKEMEAQLLQSQRMESIGLLAGSIAHDFNNLLVPITASAELGLMHVKPDDQAYVYLQRIGEAADQAAGLTRQILAFSRKQVLEVQVLNLNTVVEEYGTMIQRLIGEGIRIVTILDPELKPVSADRGQIEQVLLNLVVNARDAMPAGGALTIRTANIILHQAYAEQHGDKQAAGSYSMLSVSDTGQGMNSNTQKKIFEPFYTTKTDGRGTGLGLATVFGIVKQHRGNIWVDSEPGEGSTFRLYLHHVDSPVAETIKSVPVDELQTGTETILLVEDGAMVRNILREGLEAYGYKVLEADDVADAVRLASEWRSIDLLLTDVIMPDMNGRELYEQVIQLQPAIKVLFVSGYTDDVIVDQGILEEGVNFLQKPFSIINLVQKVRSCLMQDTLMKQD